MPIEFLVSWSFPKYSHNYSILQTQPSYKRLSGGGGNSWKCLVHCKNQTKIKWLLTSCVIDMSLLKSLYFFVLVAEYSFVLVAEYSFVISKWFLCY